MTMMGCLRSPWNAHPQQNARFHHTRGRRKKAQGALRRKQSRRPWSAAPPRRSAACLPGPPRWGRSPASPLSPTASGTWICNASLRSALTNTYTLDWRRCTIAAHDQNLHAFAPRISTRQLSYSSCHGVPDQIIHAGWPRSATASAGAGKLTLIANALQHYCLHANPSPALCV